MNPNILIMGHGRAGKTTLGNLIKGLFPRYNLIHSDALKWAMIRAKGEEPYYREHVDVQKEFEHGEYFQRTLLELFRSAIRSDRAHHGILLETGQLSPELVAELVDFQTTNVACLGLGLLSAGDMVNQCLQYDTPESWTYGLPEDYLMQHAADWHSHNERFKRECPRYGIPYVDTSRNRMAVLSKLTHLLLLQPGDYYSKMEGEFHEDA